MSMLVVSFSVLFCRSTSEESTGTNKKKITKKREIMTVFPNGGMLKPGEILSTSRPVGSKCRTSASCRS